MRVIVCSIFRRQLRFLLKREEPFTLQVKGSSSGGDTCATDHSEDHMVFSTLSSETRVYWAAYGGIADANTYCPNGWSIDPVDLDNGEEYVLCLQDTSGGISATGYYNPQAPFFPKHDFATITVNSAAAWPAK